MLISSRPIEMTSVGSSNLNRMDPPPGKSLQYGVSRSWIIKTRPRGSQFSPSFPAYPPLPEPGPEGVHLEFGLPSCVKRPGFSESNSRGLSSGVYPPPLPFAVILRPYSFFHSSFTYSPTLRSVPSPPVSKSITTGEHLLDPEACACRLLSISETSVTPTLSSNSPMRESSSGWPRLSSPVRLKGCSASLL